MLFWILDFANLSPSNVNPKFPPEACHVLATRPQMMGGTGSDDDQVNLHGHSGNQYCFR